MHSEVLKDNGLVNLVGGRDYNFRLARAEETFADDVKSLLQKAGIEPKDLYAATQVHGTTVAYADGKAGEPYLIGKHFKDTDGLITDNPNVALLIKFADCTPVVLYEPVKKVQAVVHSGWRGTVEKISHEAIHIMTKDFGAKKENILAYVGPSIAQENYEVGPEVYEAFSTQADREVYFLPHGEKYLLDMARANYELLLEAGIDSQNIEVETDSTYTSPSLHSARQEGKDYGLNAIVTMMN